MAKLKHLEEQTFKYWSLGLIFSIGCSRLDVILKAELIYRKKLNDFADTLNVIAISLDVSSRKLALNGQIFVHSCSFLGPYGRSSLVYFGSGVLQQASAFFRGGFPVIEPTADKRWIGRSHGHTTSQIADTGSRSTHFA